MGRWVFNFSEGPVGTTNETEFRYLLRVKGDSMIGAGILEGDLVVVKPQKAAGSGEIVVAMTPDGEGMVKTLSNKGNSPCLVAANPNYAPIPGPFEVVGKVIGVIRRLR